ncbi:MAG TPA: UbiA family prenyltransferase [Chitinophagaceae bacterium]|nr:UbiA family prenyltransferase [Chitinophagaceae bacterium]
MLKTFIPGIFRFFIYSNLFIAVCTLLMINQTYDLLLHGPPDKNLLGFAFSATICSYSFHWYLTSQSLIESPRIEWLKKHRVFHLVLFFIGLAGSGLFFFFLLPHWHWLAASAIITFLYSAPKIPHPWFRALRKIAIGKTIFLALVWTYVTAMLPVIIAGNHFNVPVILFIISRFFFIYAICIMFDFRDRADDKVTGIRSMVTAFSEKGVDWLFFLSLVIFAVCTVTLYGYGFSVLNIILLLVPGAIAAVIYNYAKRNFSDYLYYFILDGLMMFSALLMLVFHYF